MIGRIYVELHMALLHTKYTSFGSCGFGEKDCFMYFCYKSMADNGAHGPWPVLTKGQRLAGFMKNDHYTYYTQI